MDDGKVNILIVDDKPEKLLSLEAVLEDLRQNIVRAYSGREALRCLLNQDFAVILLDVNMPGMDGFETASLIRQRKSTEHIPIIFVTAFGDENHSSRGYSLGAVDYIQTPVVPDVLKTKVSVFVDLYKKTEQVRRQAQWLRQRANQLQKLAAASLTINSALSVDKMLQTVTDTARDLVGSHQAITMFILKSSQGHRGARTQSFASFSDKYASWRTSRLDLDCIASTIVAKSHATTRMTEQELREHPDWEIVSKCHIPPVVGGMLAAPMSGRDGSNLGVIYLSERYDGQFTHDDEAIVTQLAQMASTAIENSLYAEERETNRIKDEFLSTLSHELRTPLNAILGWSQLLRLEPLEEKVSEGLEVIERNARAQTKLVDDLLDVSRITMGKLRLSTRLLNFASIVSAAVDGVEPTARAKEIAVNFTCDTDQDRMVGDPDRLQQVAWNLLSNAVKFTLPGGKVDVRCDRIGTTLRLRVTDTGRGIDPAFLPYVFDRFRQADSTTTRSYGGLGIGLTIVRHIVEMHGGTVHAESAGDGQGSTFTVLLPVTLAAVIDQPISKPPSDSSSLPMDPLGATTLADVRILVVDDEPDARDILAAFLRRAEADVTIAATVQEALSLMARTKPHLIISDIAMPDRDGYDFIQAVRQLPTSRGGETPAIALTAYAREDDRLRALSAGFQAHLTKPVSATELIAAAAHLTCSGKPDRARAQATA